jgi:HipA-like protein
LKLNVHVLGRHVGILEQVGDFKSVMAYVPDVAPENLVSLTMPVRTESYPWDDQLHPIFQMNLPEGYLLQVLQEEFGPIPPESVSWGGRHGCLEKLWAPLLLPPLAFLNVSRRRSWSASVMRSQTPLLPFVN